MNKLEDNKHLETLDLDLRHLEQCDDGWLKEIGKSLKDLKHTLRHFEVWLWGCHHATNEGLHHVLKGLHHCE